MIASMHGMYKLCVLLFVTDIGRVLKYSTLYLQCQHRSHAIDPFTKIYTIGMVVMCG